MAGFISEMEGANKLSPSRRISEVHPGKERVTAVCFDESPCALGNVTESIIGVLKENNAGATFIAYGSTAAEHGGEVSGRKRTALPAEGSEEMGGAENQPELIRKIAASGFEIAGSGYSNIPIGSHKKSLFSRPAAFRTAKDFYLDNKKLAELLEGLTGKAVPLMSPPCGALNSADDKSVCDVYNAMFCNHLSCACDYGRGFIRDGGEAEEADRLVREVSLRLREAPDFYNGKTIGFCGGAGGFKGSPTAAALPRILKLLNEYGYRVCTVSDMLADSPFSDVGEDSEVFACARELVSRGYTVCTKSNKLRPEAALTRSEMYAMFIPPEIMKDYMVSRLTGENASFELNRRSEKEFLMTPGRAASAGMIYAFTAGWPLSGKFETMTAKTFSEFLDKAAAGKNVTWQPRHGNELKRGEILGAVCELIGL